MPMPSPLRTMMAAVIASSTLALADPAKSLELAKLPAGAIQLDARSPAWLRVTLREGRVTKIEAATEKTANLTVKVLTHAANDTTVNFESRVDHTLKLDLYVSADGKHFTYTSSCPLMANKMLIENWQEAIPWLAVAAARVVAEQSGTCD